MKNIKYIFAVIPFWMFASCSSVETDEGYVSFSIDENIAGPLQVNVETKASSSAATKAVTSEEIDEFTVSVPEISFSGKYKDIKGQAFKFHVGTYTVLADSHPDPSVAEAANGGYGCATYAGSTTVEILPLEKTAAVITCKVSNARVSVALSDGFTSYFDGALTSVRFAEDEGFTMRPLDILSKGGTSLQAYYTAGDPVWVEVTTTKLGADRAVTYRVKAVEAVESCTDYIVSLSVTETSAGGITFTVNASDITVSDWLTIASYTPASVTEDPWDR